MISGSSVLIKKIHANHKGREGNEKNMPARYSCLPLMLPKPLFPVLLNWETIYCIVYFGDPNITTHVEPCVLYRIFSAIKTHLCAYQEASIRLSTGFE
jgi:hypothetical protein